MISVAPFNSVVSSIGQKSADPERRPLPRDLRTAVVEMPGLHGLAGLQVDREQRRQQATLAQLRLDECHYKRMHHEPCKHRRFCQQRVDAIGLRSASFSALPGAVLTILART
jgi:hypothetical protein